MAAIEGQINRAAELNKAAIEDTKLLDAASLDKKIMELRQQDYGIEKIANILQISTWRVRQCLKNLE